MNLQMGKTTPLAAIQILDLFMALTWLKRTQSAPKIHGYVPPIGCATLKHGIRQPWRGGNNTQTPSSDPNQ